MKKILAILTVITIVSCGSEKSKSEQPYKVQFFGALKNMMHKGDLSAKADLADFKNSEHLYALGAIENLKGEVQIFDGQPFNTMVENGEMVVDNSFKKKAALFVYATVTEWATVNIPANVVIYEDLEKFIEKAATENNVDAEEPFPFLLEGIPESFDWHVINWKDGDTEHSHEKHIHSGLFGTKENIQVEMLGFYSDSHQAIFTHHTSNMHIHVRTVDNSLAGHVDGMTLGEGMILKLPVR